MKLLLAALLVLTQGSTIENKDPVDHHFHGNGVDFNLIAADFTLKSPPSCNSEINRATLYTAMDTAFGEATGVGVIDETALDDTHFWDLDISFCNNVPEKWKANNFALVKETINNAMIDLLGCPSDADFVQYLKLKLLDSEVCLGRRKKGTKTAPGVGRRNLGSPPKEFSCVENIGPIRNQGDAGSCVAFSLDALTQYHDTLYNNRREPNSPKYTYLHRCRVEPGSPKTCTAGMLPETIGELISQIGVVGESDFPYAGTTDEMFEDRVPSSVRRLGEEKIPQYDFKWTCKYPDEFSSKRKFIKSVKQAMSNYGPILMAVNTYDHWDCDMWNSKGKELMGGHAMAWVAYDKKGLTIRNSWDSDWCDGGTVKMSWNDAYTKTFEHCYWEKTSRGGSTNDVPSIVVSNTDDIPHTPQTCVDTPNWNDGDRNGPYTCVDYSIYGWCANCREGPNWSSLWGPLSQWGILENCCDTCGCKNTCTGVDDNRSSKRVYKSKSCAELASSCLKSEKVYQRCPKTCCEASNMCGLSVEEAVGEKSDAVIAKEISADTTDNTSNIARAIIVTTFINVLLFGVFGERLLHICGRKTTSDTYRSLVETEL